MSIQHNPYQTVLLAPFLQVKLQEREPGFREWSKCINPESLLSMHSRNNQTGFQHIVGVAFYHKCLLLRVYQGIHFLKPLDNQAIYCS